MNPPDLGAGKVYAQSRREVAAYMWEPIHVLTLNCWGLKYLSKLRSERLSEIGRQIALLEPPPHIVGLQECWCQDDFESVQSSTRHILPYSKFYYSGVFGAGLAILSKWPIEASSMVQYPLNGRPTAFYRGDWFVGKGVACATIRLSNVEGQQIVIEVFNTHTHAPYEREPHDSYVCHRTAQAWEIAKLMRRAVDSGGLVVAMGDFNFQPDSKAYEVIVAESGCRDAWAEVYGHSVLDVASRQQWTVGSAKLKMGCTVDSIQNSWHRNKSANKDIAVGRRVATDNDPDPRARRLDYVFVGGARVQAAKVCLDAPDMVRVNHKFYSLSDHFAVRTELHPLGLGEPNAAAKPHWISAKYLDYVQHMIWSYIQRQRRQRKVMLAICGGSILTTVGALVAIWWSPRNFVSFLLSFLSTFGFAAGSICGLIGGLFCTSELRLLKEFQWEITRRSEQLLAAAAGEEQDEK